MAGQIPNREITVIRGNNRTFLLAFVDLNDNLPRQKYVFPTDSVFHFRAKNDYLDVQKTGQYDPLTGYVRIDFVPIDTRQTTRDLRVPFEMDVTYNYDLVTGLPNQRHTILTGHLVVVYTRGLND